MNRLELVQDEYDPYYNFYINKLEEHAELRNAFQSGRDQTIEFFSNLTESQFMSKYAPDKWTIKEVFQHLIDTERIFSYRMFRIGRRDNTPLANFDQNIYMASSGANNKEPHQLIEEFTTGRSNSISLLNSLSDDDLRHVGVSSQTAMSARAAAFTIIGHYIWHIDIIKERYL